jgi:hypothetical protein
MKNEPIETLPMQNTDDVFRLAKAFAQSGVLGAKNEAEGVMALKVVQEVGIVAANERYNIMMGKLSKKAHAICADFQRAGGTYRIMRRDADCAELVASFGETRDMTFRFSWDDALQEPFIYAGSPDAQKAQLKKPVEQRSLKDKYATPRSRMQMLWARVISDMGQALCPSASEGMYPPEVVADFDELQSTGNEPQELSQDEVARRAAAAKPVEIVIADPALCPIGGPNYEGLPWRNFSTEHLANALASGNPEITEAHRTEIEKIIKERE